MVEQDYSYQNLSLNDLPGEQWKDLPGNEGFYKISNLGRIRRLEWKGTNKRGYAHFKSEMILKPTIGGTWNTYTQDYRKSVRVAFLKNKKMQTFSVARLVYYCFVTEFDLLDKNLYVLFKDGNPLNISLENLVLGNPKDKQARMEASGRRAAPFTGLSEEKRKQTQEKINAIKKERGTYMLSRYSLSGKLLETYINAKTAAEAMKTSQGHISTAARGKGNYLTACGFIWRRGNEPEIDMKSILDSKWLSPSPLVSQQKRIGQYDFKGKLVNTFSTIKEAVRVVKAHPNSIQRVISGKRLSCGGFIWRHETKPKISVKYLEKMPGFHHSRFIPDEMKVSQYDLDGKWIKTFVTAAEAARITKVDESDIYRVVNDKAMSAGGFLWRNGERLRIDVNTLRKHPHFSRSALEKHMKKKREKNMESAF